MIRWPRRRHIVRPHERGDGTQGPKTDDGLRGDLDAGSLWDEHPHGDHQGHTARVANGHRLAPLASADDLEVLAVKRVEGVPDGDGGTYGVMRRCC